MRNPNLSMAIIGALSGNFLTHRTTKPTLTKLKCETPVYNGTKSSFKQNRRIQLKRGFKARGKQ